MDFSKILGPNWRTSLSGYITLGAVSLVAQPDLISFLPLAIQSYILGIAKIVMVISGGTFVTCAKDSKVTGGSVPATQEAQKRLNHTIIT